ncbi:uncharacterized protein LOC118191414 [Stegodyphus dumicola]|uniref:uncharacterized protein LOC118191414 n=1 Tax=Stegodyphus dumicola TaxID=202533 RepID=UPI0015AD682C|nr:uncharacterized protein LOC118191414 [Stegodyphus dumicola]
MEVNLEKNYIPNFFPHTHQPIKLDLFYQNLPVLVTNLYLGVIFNRKLTWEEHVTNTLERTTKRLTLLKRITGSKWGCCRTTLDLTYNFYILPLITYNSETLVAASKEVTDNLEKFYSQSRRLITSAIKTTLIDELLISTQHMSVKSVIEEKAPILWKKISRLPACFLLWNSPLNLKTQYGFLQRVFDMREQLGLNWEMENLIKSQYPIERGKWMVGINLSSEVSKKEKNDLILNGVDLETIHE